MSVDRLSLSQLNAMDRSAFASYLGWIYEYGVALEEISKIGRLRLADALS
jgi:2-oxo-4-hydroxy-4-carboxy--5-ureidoimidazoline (OHCU) decarboxylase